jgi:signal transduction histidine kinase
MKRPLHIWSVFAAVLLLAVALFGWLSAAVLRLDDAQRQHLAEAEREEKVRLALWRMDSALAVLVATEDTRSPLEYQAFHSPPRAWAPDNTSIPTGRFLLPSPLMTAASTNTRLHFEFGADRMPVSPQVPPPSFRPLALDEGLSVESLLQASNRLAVVAGKLRQLKPTGTETAWTEALSRAAEAGVTNAVSPAGPAGSAPWVASGLGNYANELPEQQQFLNRSEATARQSVLNNMQVQQRNGYGFNDRTLSQQGSTTDADVPRSVGRVSPVWMGDDLFLARRVDFAANHRIQAVWLDGQAIRSGLLASVADLVPGARLLAVEPDAPVDDPRRLATVPLRLDPGSVAATPGSPWTALRIALWAAWGGLLVAAGALAVTLHGVLALSERRAEFVSAVTHELRTPLTTFRLYSEMLADGMVPDEEQRKRYLTTLCAESSRLGHLVENVLAYARLERGGSQYRRETLTLEALVHRVSPRLKERAELAGMAFVVEVAPPLATQTVTVDPGVVEQILFNLVDNAAKYGLGESSPGCLRLEALPESGKFVGLRVRDEGRGISPDVVGRLFEPFHRSAEKAAGSAPGVGLGLALSRKLSRSLGGELRQDRSVPSGTAFVLSLATAT